MEKENTTVILEIDIDGITDEIRELEELSRQIERKVYDLSRKLRMLRIVEASEENTSNASK